VRVPFWAFPPSRRTRRTLTTLEIATLHVHVHAHLRYLLAPLVTASVAVVTIASPSGVSATGGLAAMSSSREVQTVPNSPPIGGADAFQVVEYSQACRRGHDHRDRSAGSDDHGGELSTRWRRRRNSSMPWTRTRAAGHGDGSGNRFVPVGVPDAQER